MKRRSFLKNSSLALSSTLLNSCINHHDLWDLYSHWENIYICSFVTDSLLRINNMSGSNLETYSPGAATPTVPRGVALDKDGRIYISSFGTDTLLRIDDMSGSGLVRYSPGLAILDRPFTIAIGP